jgi:hypothetical protein
MNSLAPSFSDPFVGVPITSITDYQLRSDRYKKLLASAQSVIRQLEFEAEMDRTTIDDLQQQLAFVRANPPRQAPRLTDERVYPEALVH